MSVSLGPVTDVLGFVYNQLEESIAYFFDNNRPGMHQVHLYLTLLEEPAQKKNPEMLQ